MNVPPEFRRFAASREGVEAVIQRLGAGTYDVILVDGQGNWTRAVAPGTEDARETLDDLRVDVVHDGWPDHLSQMVNELDAWSTPGATRRAL